MEKKITDIIQELNKGDIPKFDDYKKELNQAFQLLKQTAVEFKEKIKRLTVKISHH